MAVIDTFLKLLAAQRAECLVLVPDEVPTLLKAEETIRLSMPAVPLDLVKRLTLEVLGAPPGENLAAAYYGGETGGNGTTDNPAVSGTGPTGVPSGPLGGPDFYTRGALVGGTSIAAPTVAGAISDGVPPPMKMLVTVRPGVRAAIVAISLAKAFT